MHKVFDMLSFYENDYEDDTSTISVRIIMVTTHQHFPLKMLLK